jgi:glycosidase
MDDYKTINVEAQLKADDPDDLFVLQFWQRGLYDRQEHADAFVYGDFEELNPRYKKIYAYIRTSEQGERWLVVLYFQESR